MNLTDGRKKAEEIKLKWKINMSLKGKPVIASFYYVEGINPWKYDLPQEIHIFEFRKKRIYYNPMSFKL